MTTRYFCTFLFLSSYLFGSPQEVFKPKSNYSTSAAITIDGSLQESIWRKSLFSDKLYYKEDSARVSRQNKIFLTYDNENIYVGFDCTLKTNVKTSTKLNKDDEGILENEWVAFAIDTYNDGVCAYAFFVDVNGNQFDGSLNSSKYLTNSFSTKWESAIAYTDRGYRVEMKIPFTKLPISTNTLITMGVLFVRNDKQNAGEFQYPFIKPDSKNKIDDFQKIELEKINWTRPPNLSGINIWDRLAYKKSKIDIHSLKGRSRGGDASIVDYYIFKKREIRCSDDFQKLTYSLERKNKILQTFDRTEFMKSYYPNSKSFEAFLERSQTSAFIVLHGDTILYERYFNGFSKDSVVTSFSVSKSIVTILVGLALKAGYIKSENDKIIEYIPELKSKDNRFGNISIKDLLSMSSGISYSSEGDPSDDDYTYQSPDLRKTTLDNVTINEVPQKKFLYNNYNTLLLGMILERVTKKSVSKYMEESLWKKIGMRNASWSLDENGFEKMESGFNCIPVDYARIALLMLNNGRLGNEQILPEDWVKKSTQPEIKPKGYYDVLLNHNIYYQYFWWGKNRETDQNDFFALGNKGEYIYISPAKKLIIIRLGFEYGMFTPASRSWPELFYQFATSFDPHK